MEGVKKILKREPNEREPNAIEEIIARYIPSESYEQAIDQAQVILEALHLAGLKVVPEEATDRMILLENTGGYHAAWRRVLWRDMHSAFDPTTWTPKDEQ
jgi:hypothetical protein